MLRTFQELDTARHAREQIVRNEALPQELRDEICAAIRAGKLSRASLMLMKPEEIALIEKTLVGLNEAAGFAQDLREMRGLLANICDGLVAMTPALSSLGIAKNTYSPESFQLTITSLLMDIAEFKRWRSQSGVPTIGSLGARHAAQSAEALPAAK